MMNGQKSRSGWLVTMLALTFVSSACGTTNIDKAGPSVQAVRALTLANVDGDDTSVAPFAEAVRSLSSGTLVIDTALDWRPGDPQREGELVKDVEADKADLGIEPARSFDTVGITSFEALQAPFLINSTALETKVLSSSISGQMLDGLSPSGLIGLAIVPGPMRRLLGRSRVLATVADLRGATIGIRPSHMTEKTLEALGAKPVVYTVGGAIPLATLDGIETNILAIEGNGYDAGAAALTSNIDLWPRPSAIFVNAKVFAGLSAEQQTWLREAGSRAGTGVVTEIVQGEATSAAIMCRRNLRFVDATPADLGALRQAVEPVYTDLESDPATKAFIAQIEAMRGSGDAAPEPAPACLQPASSPSPALSSAPVTSIDGSWEVTITKDQYMATKPPPDPSEIDPSNWGHFTMDLQAGRINCCPNDKNVGTFSLDGNHMHAVFPDGTVFDVTWSIYKGKLQLGVWPTGVSPTGWRAQPWTRVP